MVNDSRYIKTQWYPWLTELYQKILMSYQTGKGHHALLLRTSEGNGEDILLYAISRWLMCKYPIGIKSCCICRNCILMKSNNHPDYHIIIPKKDTFYIGIDTVRVFIDILYRCSYQNGVKIVSLMHSEYLTEQATNALLKVLEEPPDNTYFLLGCHSYMRLLPTLVSRCCCWLLIPPKEEIGLSWLKKNGVNNVLHASTALRLCNGAPLAAKYLLKPQNWQLRLNICMIVFNIVIKKSNFFDLLPLFNNQNHDNIICWLISLFIDALKWQLELRNFLINLDQKKLIALIASNWSIAILNDQIKQWMRCRRYFHKINGINQELLISHQLLECMQQVNNLLY